MIESFPRTLAQKQEKVYNCNPTFAQSCKSWLSTANLQIVFDASMTAVLQDYSLLANTDLKPVEYSPPHYDRYEVLPRVSSLSSSGILIRMRRQKVFEVHQKYCHFLPDFFRFLC